MSKINLIPRVTLKELRVLIPLIAAQDENDEYITPIIQSEPGCGKTSLLKMIAEDNGDKWRKPGDKYPDDKYDYIYVDCPVKDMSDIGMVIPNHDTKTLEYYVASLFCLDSPKPKVILLDEFMKAPKLLQVIFTRLMLERMVGDNPLTHGSVVFGTSNNQGDGVGDTMLAHAGNRVCIIEMQKPDVPTWLEYATTKGISRIIRAFVAMHPKVLRSYRDDGQEDNEYIFHPTKPVLSFCSPRSLEKANVIIKNMGKFSEGVLTAALAGTIGASAAKQMETFISMEKSVTDVKDILKDPKNIHVPKEIAAQLMIMFQALDVVTTQDELSSFMHFVNRIESEEVQSIFFSLVLSNSRTVRIAKNNEEVKAWAKNNHQLF
jgi:hypothetical protein